MLNKKSVILCVDDEHMNLSLLEAILLPQGYKVIKAQNGEEALGVLHNNAVDCVLLDVMMPKMNGYEVCKIVKDDERYRHIPVIMITSLTSKEERIKSIRAGADDFISKPFEKNEVLARINMLLKVKMLDENLRNAYSMISDLTMAGENIIKQFNPFDYDLFVSLMYLVSQLIRISPENIAKPECIIIGLDHYGIWRWYKYSKVMGAKEIKQNKIPVLANMYNNAVALTFKYNRGDSIDKQYSFIFDFLEANQLDVLNMAGYLSNTLYFLALNYGKEVTDYDVAVIKSMIVQTLFLKTIAAQINETHDAFNYTIYTLARASEVNDEDTGNHVLRVGEYCAVLARELGLGGNYIDEIKTQAIVHDVGKIHIPAEILKKPSKLTVEEFEEMKKHPLYGAKILGEHVKFTMGKEIALCHHEKWDGSGYPQGLKEQAIPLSARIMTIADQYDALRNARPYKPAFEHDTVVSIISNGDGRTLPSHFDPDVLNAFVRVAPKFAEVYERLKG